MLPNVRLMIAAILASAVALSCGFGIFAAFRISHEPFAHLPAAIVPPRLVAENAVVPVAHGFRVGDVTGQTNNPLRAAEDITGQTTGPEIHAAAYAEESEQKAAPDAIAAAVIDPPASINLQDKSSAETPAGADAAAPEPPAPAVSVSELPALPRNEDHAGDATPIATHETAARDLTAPDRTAAGPTAPSPVTANDTPAERTPAAEPSNASGSIEPSFSSVPVADSAPARLASAEAEAAPADAADSPDPADNTAAATSPDLPLPRERPSVVATPAAEVVPVAHERRLAPVAVAPKHPRVLIRAIHAPRFPAAYYVRTQYAQTVDPGYAYAQTGEAQGQVMIRHVVRPRLIARRNTR